MRLARMLGFRSADPAGWTDYPSSVRPDERVSAPVPRDELGSSPPNPLSVDEWRAVPISSSQQRQLENLGFALIRAGVEDGSSSLVLGIALAWRFAPTSDFAPSLEVEKSEDDEDELERANVVPLDPYSRKVGK